MYLSCKKLDLRTGLKTPLSCLQPYSFAGILLTKLSSSITKGLYSCRPDSTSIRTEMKSWQTQSNPAPSGIDRLIGSPLFSEIKFPNFIKEVITDDWRDLYDSVKAAKMDAYINSNARWEANDFKKARRTWRTAGWRPTPIALSPRSRICSYSRNRWQHYHAHSRSSKNQNLVSSPVPTVGKAVSDSEKLCFNLMCNLNVVGYDEVKVDTAAVQNELVFDQNKITKISFFPSNLQAYVLPTGLKWPTAMALKQKYASCPNLYLHRGGVPNDGRLKNTIESLRAGRNVVWLGSPGIGKTWGLNFILMEFLRNIGKPGWPPNVLVRVSKFLYHFVLREGNLSIHKVIVHSLSETENYCYDLSEDWSLPDAVMLLELQEDEKDPKFEFPVFTTSSSRDADINLKTLTKSATAWLVVEPWKEDEVRAATIAQHLVRGISTVDNDLKIAIERFEVVGGLPRYIFAPEDVYKVYLGKLTPVTGRTIKSMQNLAIENIPPGIKFYIAPFVREGVEVPLLSSEWNGFHLDSSYSPPKSPAVYEFGFLSEYVKKLFVPLIETPEEVKMLERFGVKYQIDEAIVKHGGLLSNSVTSMAPKHQRGEWEWYRDPGSANKISEEFKLSKEKIPELPWCDSEVKFFPQHLRIPANELKPRTCYTPTKQNSPVADMIMVNKEKCVVYAIQVTRRDARYHSFSENSLKEFMKNLGLLDKNDKPTGDYRLCLIAVNDWSQRASRGVMTHVANKNGPKRSVIEINEPWAKIVDCYIVRACLSFGSVEKSC